MGNKTRRGCYGLVILAALRLAGWAQDESVRNPRLVVAVYDDAGVAPEIVLRAETQASRVFQEAGISVRWRNPLWETRPELALVAAQEKSAWLMVRIVPHSRDLKGE